MEELKELKELRVWITILPPSYSLIREATVYCNKNPNHAVILTDNFEQNKSRIRAIRTPGIHVIG